MSVVSANDVEMALVDLSAFAAHQCAEHVRRRGRPDEAVSRELLAEMARRRGLIITYADERVAA